MLSRNSLDHSQLTKKELERIVRNATAGSPEDKGEEEEKENKLKSNPSKATTSPKEVVAMKSNGWKKIFHCCRGKEPVEEDPSKEKEDMKTFAKWQKRTCKTSREFFILMRVLTECAEDQLNGLDEAIQMLAIERKEEGLEGLSVIGEFLWILSYGFQNLIDYEKKTEPKNMAQIRSLFVDFAKTSSTFLDIADFFHKSVVNMRRDSVIISKRVIKIYKLKTSPPDIHSDVKEKKPGRKRLDSGSDMAKDEDGYFEIRYSPFLIMIQLDPNDKKQKGWLQFESLSIEERQRIYQVFLQAGYDLLESTSNKVVETCRLMSEIPVKIEAPSTSHGGGDLLRRSRSRLKIKQNGREITGAMEIFIKGHSPNSKTAEEEKPQNIDELLQLFWSKLDQLYEKSYEILRLARETRDAIRTCYIYMESFYHWKQPDFESNSSRSKFPTMSSEGRRSAYFGRLLSHEKHREKELETEETIYLSLVDFSTSIYGRVGQTNPIYAGGMRMAISSEEDEVPEVKSIIPEVEKSIKKKETTPAIEAKNPEADKK